MLTNEEFEEMLGKAAKKLEEQPKKSKKRKASYLSNHAHFRWITKSEDKISRFIQQLSVNF